MISKLSDVTLYTFTQWHASKYLYSEWFITFQEIYTRFMLTGVVFWIGIGIFTHILQRYFTDIETIVSMAWYKTDCSISITSALEILHRFDSLMPWSSQIGYDQMHRMDPQILDDITNPLQWRHDGRNGVSNHQPHDCLRNRLFRHKSTKNQSSASQAPKGSRAIRDRASYHKISNSLQCFLFWSFPVESGKYHEI